MALMLTKSATERAELHLVQLGLNDCKICGTAAALAVDRRIAGIPLGMWGKLRRPDDLLETIMIRCRNCGHLLFFALSDFFSSDELILEESS